MQIHAHLHPEIHKALKISAIQDDLSMTEKLHAILCGEFERPDLLKQCPVPVASR